MARLSELACVCRSKNAGPFTLTMDVVFDRDDLFEAVVASGVLNVELFARLYQVPEEAVLLTIYPQARAIKASLPRLVPAGNFGDSDVYGAQQHAPLLSVEVPVEARSPA